ncbi:hypothetical protein ACFVAQ_16785 [Streptomyces sp. NPDC057651]|uniref:hypothetical protein n=1 Tax=Streptomyces sp. NPDC057651 TaxID=3346194 RepID=UPI0036758D8C
MTTTTADSATLARQAAEAIREFNHLTFPNSPTKPGLTYPGEAYDAIGALKILAQRLPQAMEQIGTALDVLGTNDHLGSAIGEDPARHVALVQEFLSTAMDCAGGLAQCLELAHSEAGPLLYTGPEDGPEDEPCGEGMCQCSCIGTLHPCGCDCPHDDECDCDVCDARAHY